VEEIEREGEGEAWREGLQRSRKKRGQGGRRRKRTKGGINFKIGKIHLDDGELGIFSQPVIVLQNLRGCS
jgi:hypothetical protein